MLMFSLLRDPCRISTQLSIRHCSLCQGNTEYYCLGCHQDLCIQCKETHVIDLSTKGHKILSYLEKKKYQPKLEQSADQDVFRSPVKQKMPSTDPSLNQDVFRSPVPISPLERVEINRRQFSEIIFHIRSETIYDRCAMLEVIKRDIPNIHTKVTKEGQSEIGKLAEEVKEGIDNFLAGNIQDRSLLQKIRMTKHFTKLVKDMYRYEQLETIMKYKSVKFLQIITRKRQPEEEKCKHRQNRKQKIMVSIVDNGMKKIRFVENGRRLQPGIEHLLTILPSTMHEKSVTLKDVGICGHVFSLSPDRVWVSDVNNLILADTAKGDKLHSLENSLKDSVGKYTVNSDYHLIYIDENYDIRKISGKETTPLIVIKRPDSTWKPKCVFSSNLNEDLLVGLVMEGTETGKIKRYDNKWGLKQIITLESTLHSQYRSPAYITENNNGDIVVSDDRAVVVTSCEGKYRFSYTGPTSEYELLPRGICVDAFSNILVCDAINYTIHMIDKDGQFLSHLLTMQSPGLTNHPWSLSYDVNTHLLFVGSCNEVLFVYRYINRNIHFTCKLELFLFITLMSNFKTSISVFISISIILNINDKKSEKEQKYPILTIYKIAKDNMSHCTTVRASTANIKQLILKNIFCS